MTHIRNIGDFSMSFQSVMRDLLAESTKGTFG